jgi:hypothetical protein
MCGCVDEVSRSAGCHAFAVVPSTPRPLAASQHNVSNFSIIMHYLHYYIIYIYHTFCLLEWCTTTTTPLCYVKAASTAVAHKLI